MFGLVLLFVYVFLLSFQYFDHLAWGRGSWSLCLSCIFLLAMHTLICHFFSFSLSWGLAAASACGSSWTFLFTFFNFNMFIILPAYFNTLWNITTWGELVSEPGASCLV